MFISSPKPKAFLIPQVTTLQAIGDLPPLENGDKDLEEEREYYRPPFSAYQVEK